MSQINIRNLSNENEDGAPDIVGVSTFSATSYIVPPVGTTAQRPDNPQGGDLRFNTDTASLEYFRGDTLNWSQIEMTSPDLDGGARAIWAGGLSPSLSNVIDYSTIPTLGNTTDFGDTSVTTNGGGACPDPTRLVMKFGAQDNGTTLTNVIEYVQISTTGNSVDFGDSVLQTYSVSNGTASTGHGGL